MDRSFEAITNDALNKIDAAAKALGGDTRHLTTEQNDMLTEAFGLIISAWMALTSKSYPER